MADIGVNAYSSVYAIAQAGTGVFYLDMLFYATVGSTIQLCHKKISFDIDKSNCTNTCRKAFITAKTKAPALIVNNTQLSIVPNPAKQFISVLVNKLNGGGELIIVDYLGRIVYKQIATGKNLRNEAITINIQDLHKGLYIVQVKGKDGTIRSGKLVVDP